MAAQDGLTRLAKLAPEAREAVDQRVVRRVLEDGLHAGNPVAQAHRPPALGHRGAEGLEVVRSQVVNQPCTAERRDDQVGGLPVLHEHPQPQLARVPLAEFRGQEAVAQVGHGQPVGLLAGGSPGV